MPRIVTPLSVALVLFTLASASASSQNTATLAEEHTGGVTSRTASTGPAMERSETAERLNSRAGTILWQRHQPTTIYSSAGLAGLSETTFAGTWWNTTPHVEAVPIAGSGIPDWTVNGTKFFVDASRAGEVLAAIDFSDDDSTATVMEWRPGSSTPLWTYQIHPCRSMTYQGWASRKPIQVSDDGSTIAVAVTMWADGGQRGRLFVFDAGTGTPVVDYDIPTGNVVATAISAQGEFIAMAGWPNIYVYDRYGQTLRWSGTAGAGNDALAISGDGRYLSWGWSTFYLREWTGSTYSVLWTQSQGSGTYVGQCAFSNDNETLGLSWDNGNTTSPNVVWLELYELPSLTMLWDYHYVSVPRSAHSSGEQDLHEDGPSRDPVDVPSNMRFSPDGQRLAVCGWGGTFPEVHVFNRSAPEPIFILDTPGSMFDIDLLTAPSGATHLVTAGKDVHAGYGGTGGDFYAVEIPGEFSDVPQPEGVGDQSGLRLVAPSLSAGSTQITYALSEPGPVRLTLHDASGRILHTLLEVKRPAGTYVHPWDGRDARGERLSSGVYFVRSEIEGAITTRRMIVAE